MKKDGSGWIKIDRSIRDHWIFSEKPYSRFNAWIDLLMLAGYQDNKVMVNGKPIVLRRGSFLTSSRKLADRWGWSRNKVLRFLDVLRTENMVQTCTNGGTILTIVNYSVYQSSRTTNGASDEATREASDEATRGTQRRKSKKVKESKEKKEDFLSEPDDDDPGEDPAESLRKWKEANGIT